MSRRRERIPPSPTWYDRLACPGKVPFQSETTAKQRAREISTADGRAPMHAYRCSACSGWHLGHDADDATGIRYGDRRFQLDPKPRKGTT